MQKLNSELRTCTSALNALLVVAVDSLAISNCSTRGKDASKADALARVACKPGSGLCTIVQQLPLMRRCDGHCPWKTSHPHSMLACPTCTARERTASQSKMPATPLCHRRRVSPAWCTRHRRRFRPTWQTGRFLVLPLGSIHIPNNHSLLLSLFFFESKSLDAVCCRRAAKKSLQLRHDARANVTAAPHLRTAKCFLL